MPPICHHPIREDDLLEKIEAQLSNDPLPEPPPAHETYTDTDHQPQRTETPLLSLPRQTRNAEANFSGEKNSNATHATDPDALVYNKVPGAAAMLCLTGHTWMEGCNGVGRAGGFDQRRRPLRAQGWAGDGRTTSHAGNVLSQRHRKNFEEPFCLSKTFCGMAQIVHQGHDRVHTQFNMSMVTC
jgi:hypothetical protein